ncbi:hypothetical protein H2200_010623 [Cladophialophora chaetospira]|uniref:Uncharacterized protein n=1 Tax=Cladophialophora chaetospira TaxID=386627 RepID=A0AA38X1X3_9EURO|nr:hypothetical protein H2200_010623 [Cladophialophora chaetospira]
MDRDASLNPKFDKLSIALNDNPDQEPDPNRETCSGGMLAGYVTYDPTKYQDQGLVSICPHTLQTFYSLHDIMYPPEWALDENGNPEEGFGCDGLLGRDTDYMLSPGGMLLHEFMHWPYLFQDIPDYSTLIRKYPKRGFSMISDYKGRTASDPEDGYGPFYAMALPKKISSSTGRSKAIQNADNYVWYALTKFWTFRCSRRFGPAISQEDANLRGFFDDAFSGDSEDDASEDVAGNKAAGVH